MMYGDRHFLNRYPFMRGNGFGLWDLIMIVGIILIVVAIVMYLRNSKSSPKGKDEDALKILNERYARGDISEEEYLKKKEHLKK